MLFLVYKLNCKTLERQAVGIVDAPNRRQAMRRAWREEWEYSIETKIGWDREHIPAPIPQSKAGTDWQAVIDWHRIRRQKWHTRFPSYYMTRGLPRKRRRQSPGA